jgi:hypothetical protein
MAAVAALNEAIRAEPSASGVPSGHGPAASLPEKLQEWLDKLLDNVQKIVGCLPDIESYAVSVGLPAGVGITVTFTAHPK